MPIARALGLALVLALLSSSASAQRTPRARPSASLAVEDVTGALTTAEVGDLPTRAAAPLTQCAQHRTATIVTDASVFELAVDVRGHVTTATVMTTDDDIIVDDPRTHWLSCASSALRRLRFPRRDAVSTVSVRVTWSSGGGTRGGELGSTSGTLTGRRSSVFDHAIESRPHTAPETPVGYSRDVLRRVVSSHAAEVRHCYETQLVDHPGMEGTLTLAFTIAPDGTVSAATAEDDQPHVAALTACVIGALRRWSFPAPDDGAPAQISYPFVFRHHSGKP